VHYARPSLPGRCAPNHPTILELPQYFSKNSFSECRVRQVFLVYVELVQWGLRGFIIAQERTFLSELILCFLYRRLQFGGWHYGSILNVRTRRPSPLKTLFFSLLRPPRVMTSYLGGRERCHPHLPS